MEHRGVKAHGLVGPFDSRAFKQAQTYCRVGPLACLVRWVLVHLEAEDIPLEDWGKEATWATYLPANELIDPRTAATGCRNALSRRRSDWRAECNLFQRQSLPYIPEDWSESAWEDPDALEADRRSASLDGRAAVPFRHLDYALYGDGGHNGRMATCCSQARSFGEGDEYWHSSACVTDKLMCVLPKRYGYEKCTVHTAELVAMLNSLRWRQPGHWNLAVYDRSALFDVLKQAAGGRWHDVKRASLLPLVTRLRHILRELQNASSSLPRALFGERSRTTCRSCGTSSARWRASGDASPR